MSEAVIKFTDGRTNRYKNAYADYEKRVVFYFDNGKTLGFSPFEAIVCLSWKKQEEGQKKCKS